MAASTKRNPPWIMFLACLACWVWAMAPVALAYDHPRDHGHNHNADPDPPEDEDEPCPEPCADPCKSTGSPVTLVDGNLILQFSDLDIGSASVRAGIQRTYNSIDSRNGNLGSGWTSNLELRAIPITDGEVRSVLIRWPTGPRHRFVEQPDGSYASPLGSDLKLTKDEGTGNFTLTSWKRTKGTRFVFDPQGTFLRSVDRNGNTLDFSYDDATGVLTQVTAPGGRTFSITREANGKIGSITDSAGRTIQYQYDDAGNLICVTDPMGNATTYAYDAAHQLTGIFDPLGQQTLSVTYDSQGRVSRLTDAEGDFTYAYSKGETKKTNKADGGVWTYRIDPRGVITKIIDPLGNETKRFYDQDYNLVLTVFPLGNAVQYSYDTQNNVIEVRRKASIPDWPTVSLFLDDVEGTPASLWSADPPWGTTTANSHSASTSWTDSPGGDYGANVDASLTLLAPIDLTQALEAILSFWTKHETEGWYSDYGLVDVSVDAGATWTNLDRMAGSEPDWIQKEYDLANYLGEMLLIRLRFVTNGSTENDGWYIDDILVSGKVFSPPPPDASDVVTSYTYNALDLVETITDPLAVVTKYEYDANGNRTKVIEAFGDPLQRETTFTYDGSGNLSSVTNPAGHATAYEYDAAGNMTRVTDALGNATAYTYDAAGNRVSTTDALNNTTTHTYDAKGNLLSISDPLGNTTQMAYDENNRLASLTDPEENATTCAYDPYGRLLQITDPLQHSTVYQYDGSGRRTRLTDANGKQTLYTYDLAGRLASDTNALGKSTGYGYDPNGNRTSLTDANGNTTTFEYDAFHRLAKTTYPDGTFDQTAFDAADRIAARTDRMGRTTTFSLDALGRLLTKTYPDSSTVTFAYDVLDNMIGATNAAAAISLTYDALGRRLTESNDTWGKTVTYAYDAAGRRASMTDPEGQTTTYGYDVAGRLTQISHVVMGVVKYGYDAAGRRIGKLLPNGTTTAYAYDAAGRLFTINHRKSDNSPLLKFEYTLDAVGNRLTMTDNDGAHNYSYDNIYQVVGAAHPNPAVNPVETYTYDAVGNRLTSHLSSGYSYDANNRLLADDHFEYFYGANDNLTSLTSKTDGSVTHYTYDFENRLVRVDLPDATVVTYSYDALGRRIDKTVNGSTTRLLHADKDIICEYDGSMALAALYLHGAGVDEPLVMRRGGSSHCYHEDGLGSIGALTTPSGAFSAAYLYDSFGNLQKQTGGAGNPYTYTAREWNPSTMTYYCRARVYLPAIGRFAQPDPLGVEGDINPYAYGRNNPVNWRDPWGLLSCREKCIRDYNKAVRRAHRNAQIGNVGCTAGAAICLAAVGWTGAGAGACWAGYALCEAANVAAYATALSDATEDETNCLSDCQDDEQCPVPGSV